jgi:hypothetical protein
MNRGFFIFLFKGERKKIEEGEDEIKGFFFNFCSWEEGFDRT